MSMRGRSPVHSIPRSSLSDLPEDEQFRCQQEVIRSRDTLASKRTRFFQALTLQYRRVASKPTIESFQYGPSSRIFTLFAETLDVKNGYLGFYPQPVFDSRSSQNVDSADSYRGHRSTPDSAGIITYYPDGTNADVAWWCEDKALTMMQGLDGDLVTAGNRSGLDGAVAQMKLQALHLWDSYPTTPGCYAFLCVGPHFSLFYYRSPNHPESEALPAIEAVMYHEPMFNNEGQFTGFSPQMLYAFALIRHTINPESVQASFFEPDELLHVGDIPFRKKNALEAVLEKPYEPAGELEGRPVTESPPSTRKDRTFHARKLAIDAFNTPPRTRSQSRALKALDVVAQGNQAIAGPSRAVSRPSHTDPHSSPKSPQYAVNMPGDPESPLFNAAKRRRLD